jgi:predicted RNA-binding protein YlqC (UPF0109 family)
MSDIDQQFIEYVVKSLVGKPDAVHIDRRIDEKGVLLELTVDPEDLGRVIGKRGATAQSLRTLLRALGTKNDARYNLKIIDNGVGDHARGGDSDVTAPASDDSVAKDDQTAAPTSDEPATDSPATTEPEPEPEPEPGKPETEVPAEAENTEEDQTSDRLRAAREELADLDDLDV